MSTTDVRLFMIKQGMEMEFTTGGRMRMTRKAQSCFTIVRREFGITGNKLTQYKKFCEKFGLEAKVLVDPKAPRGFAGEVPPRGQ